MAQRPKLWSKWINWNENRCQFVDAERQHCLSFLCKRSHWNEATQTGSNNRVNIISYYFAFYGVSKPVAKISWDIEIVNRITFPTQTLNFFEMFWLLLLWNFDCMIRNNKTLRIILGNLSKKSFKLLSLHLW